MKIGTRVLTIIEVVDGEIVKSFGEGVYAGHFVPPPEIGGFNLGTPNPRIDLDNGKTVWGCECWWGPIDAVKKRLGDMKWEAVDIDEARETDREERTRQTKEDTL